MDLSLLPTPASEHKKQSTGELFTIRSASSPSYRLSRRAGIRKTRGCLEEGSERTEGAAESAVRGAHVGAVTNKEENHTFDGYQSKTGRHDRVKGQREANNTPDRGITTQLNQDVSADKTKTELDNDISVNSQHSSERRGRAEWRRYELPSRSKSFDCRASKRSPDRDNSHDLLGLSSIGGGGIGKRSEYLGERRAEWEGERGRVMSSVQLCSFTGTTNDDKDMSPSSYLSQTLKRGDRGSSLPSRLRSLSGPGADVRVAAAATGPKGSQSILERIEKLYRSTGFSKTEDYSKSKDCAKAVLSHHRETTSDFSVWPPQTSHEWAIGGTFPRRFSPGSTNSPETSTTPFTGTQNNTSEKAPLRTTRTEERLLRGPWQGQTVDRFSEDRGLVRGAASEKFGTMSLDRVRSKNSIAAQLRSARAAGEIPVPPPPHASLREEESPSWRDSQRGGAGSRANVENVETDELKGRARERMGGFKEGEEQKKPDNGAAFKCSTDDVFELNPQKATTKANEVKKVSELMSVSSADSVKNRINQFEALTQRFQDQTPGQALPRRTFSVPTQTNRTQGGVKKSWSAKAIGQKDGSERLQEAGEAKEMFSKGKWGSASSLSVGEVGLSLEERKQKDLDHDGNNRADDLQTSSSKFKNSLEVPLKTENQGPHGGFSIDETDFTKVPSPDEARKRPTYLQLSISSDSGGQQTSPSPVEDKTPSNTPTNSPHLSPRSQPDNPTVTPRESETASRDAAKSPRQDPPLLHGPLATSPHGRNASLVSTDVDAALPYRSKSVLDMDAWLSGLDSEINVWNDSEEEEDDDASTQKDEDSNYDSDSGESSVTITSNMSQSDQRSFSVRWVAARRPPRPSFVPRTLILLLRSLSDLCNFAGVDYESEGDDDWQVTTRRSASLSSDMSAFSCVSVMPSEELDKLLEDVRSLGDSNLQVDFESNVWTHLLILMAFLYFYCLLQFRNVLTTS